MRKKHSVLKLAVCLLCVAIAAGLFAGCGGKQQEDQPPQDGQQTIGSQVQPASQQDPEPGADDEPKTEPEADPEEPVKKETAYGSGTWIVTATGGEMNEYNELKLVDGELIYHTLESDEGKGTFGEGSPIENSRCYGLTVEEIVEKFETQGFEVKVKAG